MNAAGRRATQLIALWCLPITPAIGLGQEVGSVDGTVVDSAGLALDGATVHVAGTGRTAVVSVDGTFSIGGVPAGVRHLRFARLGHVPVQRSVRVPAGGVARVEVTMTPRPLPLDAVRVRVTGTPADLVAPPEILATTPGGISYVPEANLRSTRQANLADALGFAPGVYVAPKFGAADKAQVSVRGSGDRSSIELQGVNVLIDGMPYRQADGFTDLASLELLSMRDVSVLKGANAFRHGGATLGGAIDFRRRTGRTAPSLEATVHGGSYGYFKGQVAVAGRFERFDYYAAYARTDLDGYRELSANRRDRVNLNLGWSVSPRFDVRVTYLFADVDEERPGPLTAFEFAADPRQAAPPRVSDPWGRSYELHHAGAILRARLDSALTLEVSPWLQRRDARIPTFRFIEQDSRDAGADVRLAWRGRLGEREHEVALGLQGALGHVGHRWFLAEGGSMVRDQRDEAASVAGYLEDAIALSRTATMIVGLRYDRARRAVADHWMENGDQSATRWYSAWLPRFGLLLAVPSVDGELFANVSRTYEPPLLLELTSDPDAVFLDLEAQRAWQFELGLRGRLGPVAGSAAVYDMEVRGEMLGIQRPLFPGSSATAPSFRNANRTRRLGVELELEAELSGRVGGRLSYTWSRSSFVRDSVFDGNDVPGAPDHVIRLAATYSDPSGFRITPELGIVPAAYFVDSANTVENDGWVEVGARAEWVGTGAGVRVFVEGRNLTDARHSPAVATDHGAARYYLPADGPAIYAGISWSP